MNILLYTAVGSRKKRALVIAISKYRELSPLNFCVNDGEGISGLLKSFGYEIPDERKIIGEGDWQTVRDALIKFFTNSNVSSNDILLLYYSGHGISDAYGEAYLATSEVNPDFPLHKGISFDEIRRMIDRSASQRVVNS